MTEEKQEKHTVASLAARLAAAEVVIQQLLKLVASPKAVQVLDDGTFVCGVCGAKAKKGTIFCPANPTHSTVAKVAEPSGEIKTIPCIQVVGEELNEKSGKMHDVKCGEPVTGTRAQIGSEFNNRCLKHRS